MIRGMQAPNTPLEEVDVLYARDGFPLSRTLYRPTGKERGLVVLAGATGVLQGFYARFARELSADGLLVLTLDYRGIGRSRQGNLRGFRADYFDWAERDLAAAIDWAVARGPTVVVGHSFGGHAFGLIDNANRTRGLLSFATGAGWHGHMPLLESWRVRFLWNVVGPPAVAALGYLPMRRLGMGEDLPVGVYRQWRHWCSFPGYFFDDPEAEPIQARAASVTVPIRAVNALDDDWAPPRSAQAFFAGYRRAPLELLTVDPRETGPIGHLGYFRPRARRLWAEAARFLGERLAA